MDDLRTWGPKMWEFIAWEFWEIFQKAQRTVICCAAFQFNFASTLVLYKETTRGTESVRFDCHLQAHL